MAQKHKMILTTPAIYKYFCGISQKIDDIILCTPKDTLVTTTDQELYEALASIEDRSIIDVNKLVKFLEVVEIDASERIAGKPRTILTPDGAAAIRAGAQSQE